MSATFTIDGYVKRVNIVNVGSYQKALVTVSSMRDRKDREGNNQYDTLDFQCFVHGTPSFEEGSFIIAKGEIQGYKDKNGEWQKVNFATSVGVDHAKFREPKEKEHSENAQYSHRQAEPVQHREPQKTFAKPSTDFKRRMDEPVAFDPSTAAGPELFNDTNIPF